MLNDFVFDWLPAGRLLSSGRPAKTHDATVQDGDYHWVLFVRDPASHRSTLQWEVARFHSKGAGVGFPALYSNLTDLKLEKYGEAVDLVSAKADAEACFKNFYKQVHP